LSSERIILRLTALQSESRAGRASGIAALPMRCVLLVIVVVTEVADRGGGGALPVARGATLSVGGRAAATSPHR